MKIIIPRTGMILFEKSRTHSVTRQRQQMPNGRSKPSSKEREIQQIS